MRYRRRRCGEDRRDWAEKMKAMRRLYGEEQQLLAERDQLQQWRGDMKRLWQSLHGVLGEAHIQETDAHSADKFATFFLQ